VSPLSDGRSRHPDGTLFQLMCGKDQQSKAIYNLQSERTKEYLIVQPNHLRPILQPRPLP
jgi:hypothetical protein